MKSAQWTAVLILALMVGGLTFVMVYLGDNNPPTPIDPVDLPSLTFAHKKFPLDGHPAPTSEVDQFGHQDYWFENKTGQKLTVGLNDKGCTCSQVKIAVVPESWNGRFLTEVGARVLQRALLGLDGLPTLAATEQDERKFPEFAENEVSLKTLDLENSVDVPDGALGWVRLSWRRAQAIPLRTHAGLWMGQRGSNSNARLEVVVKIADPLEVNKEVAFNPFDYRDLTKGKTGWIKCWSVTRPKFNIKAELVRTRGTAESDPVEVGQPIPLNREQMRYMEQTQKELEQLRVLSGYRIPVTINGKAKDGTPIEWGHFQRYVQLSSPDAGIEPVQVRVAGEVRGDVTVVGAKEGGGISLGPFPRRRGAHGEVLLQTEETKADLDLELDTARIPEYMKVQFSKDAVTAPNGTLREWNLRVEVPSNAANGEFPRADDPVYRDSAIYVKTISEKKPNTKANPPHTIRVPVYGTANDG